MSKQLHKELKKDLPAGEAGFQLERLILFSDAVKPIITNRVRAKFKK